MRVSIFVPLYAVISVGTGVASFAHADVLAYDTASNYATSGWVNGSNAGTGTPGFTSPWSLSTAGASATAALNSSFAPFGGYAWELNAAAGTGDSASAARSFPELSTGDYITLDLDASNVDQNGFEGAYFFDQPVYPFPPSSFSFSVDEFQLFVQPIVAENNGYASQDYLIDDGSSAPIDTGLSANGGAVQLYLKLISADTHTYTATLQQGSETFTTTGELGINPFDPTDQIASVTFADGASGSAFDLNNLDVVPLPPAVIAASPLLALLGLRNLRRR